MKIPDDIADFLRRQSFVVVSSRGPGGRIHNACKGIVRIDSEGRVWLLDLYLRQTYRNLIADPRMSITAVDEASFSGYCLEGEGRILGKDEAPPGIVKEWEEKINARISERLVRNIRGEKGHKGHPEARLPQPRYIIVMEVRGITDLTPEHLK